MQPTGSSVQFDQDDDLDDSPDDLKSVSEEAREASWERRNVKVQASRKETDPMFVAKIELDGTCCCEKYQIACGRGSKSWKTGSASLTDSISRRCLVRNHHLPVLGTNLVALQCSNHLMSYLWCSLKIRCKFDLLWWEPRKVLQLKVTAGASGKFKCR